MSLFLIITRWVGAIACFILALMKLLRLAPAENREYLGVDFSLVWPLLLVIGFVMGGVCCMSPELVHWISFPIRNFMESLFYPNDRCVPPPDHTLARLYTDQGRYDEALAHYKTMVANHPQELLAYVEAIKLALEIGQPKVAERFFKRGMSKITSAEFKTYLWALYEATKTKSREGVLKVQTEIPTEIEALIAKKRQRVWRDHPNL